ncbi:MAG: SCP2 sterol-binding domain-containing protein [Gammaproteobacteria bacterium]|nr:SCP2 sterol-binding domain-containing protein [Gammaproteobacteria bacterium]
MKDQFIHFIQSAINQYIALDPESSQRIAKLKNKIITIELKGLNITFQLVFTDNIEIKMPVTLAADTTITGTPLRLLQMSFTKKNQKQFFADDVAIEGNLELGQHIIDLFNHMEIDWEEYLSRYIGDTPAHHIGRFARKLKKINQHTRETLLQTVNEYVHEEINFFPPREALQDFFKDVDELRMDADRVEARIQTLRRRLL